MVGRMKYCLPWKHKWVATGSVGNVIFIKCVICDKESIRFAK